MKYMRKRNRKRLSFFAARRKQLIDKSKKDRE